MLKLLLLASAAAALSAGPVLAADPPPSGPRVAPAAATPADSKDAKVKPAKEKVICEEETRAGSHIPHVVCRAQNQSNDSHVRSTETLDRLIGSIQPPLPVGNAGGGP